MKKLMIYTNKEHTTIHIINQEDVFDVLIGLLRNDINTEIDNKLCKSLDKIMEDNDISFECLAISKIDTPLTYLLPEGIKLTSQKTEYYTGYYND